MKRDTAHGFFLLLSIIASVPFGLSTALIFAELYSGRNSYAILYLTPYFIFFWLVLIGPAYFIVKRSGISFRTANKVLGVLFLASLLHFGNTFRPSGMDAAISIHNRGRFDARDVQVKTESGTILRRKVVYTGFGEGRGFAFMGGHSITKLPEEVLVSWNNFFYQDNKLVALPSKQISVSVKPRIPRKIVHNASGWNRKRLVITLNILDDDVAFAWALWPSLSENHAPSDGPLAFGGDELPVESLENQLYIDLFRNYRNNPKAAQVHLDKALAKNVDLNRYLREKPILCHVLSEPGNGWYARMLLQNGANPNLVAMDSQVSPLMLAAGEGDKELVADLISRHVDINQQNINGDTALIYAAHAGHIDTVALLLEAGADKSVNDYSALDGAKSQGFDDVVKLLQK